MTNKRPIDAITRVMNALRYSMASYLCFARPWVAASAQSVADTIGHMAEVHHHQVIRIGELLVVRHGHVESGTFPRFFTGLNGLSMDYLLPLVFEDQKQIIGVMETTAADLEHDAEASSLVADLVATEKRHIRLVVTSEGDRVKHMGASRPNQGIATHGYPLCDYHTLRTGSRANEQGVRWARRQQGGLYSTSVSARCST